MKVKTSDLIDTALDWAVAKCEDALHPLGNVVIEGRSLWLAIGGQAHVYMEEDIRYAPSDDWAQGGPIIEREKIETYWHTALDMWAACHDGNLRYGATPLIAAMRALVQSKLGDEIDIPKEFT